MSLTAETQTGVAPVAAPLPFHAPLQQQTKDTETRHDNKVEEKKKVSVEEAHKGVKQINEQLQAVHTELSFSVDSATDKVVLKILDTKTGEVVRQIPAEDALKMSSHISRLLGLMVDENA